MNLEKMELNSHLNEKKGESGINLPLFAIFFPLILYFLKQS